MRWRVAGPPRRGADQHVAPRGQRLQAVEILVVHAFARIAVVVADGHVEARRAACDLLADRPQAEDAQLLARDIGRQADGVAPDALAAQAVQRAQAAHDGDQQAEGVVGHAVVVGARAVGHDDAARAGGVQGDVLVAGAQGADQFQRRHHGDLLGRQPRGADGQHRAETLALGGDGRRAFRRGGGIDQVINGGYLRLVQRRHAVEDEQGDFGRGHGGVS
ncbi:hypothetical protein QE399_004037 [Paracidovorax wautersii]|uniref:Uncharacterized protein n=1 Tax=Paracidovorax wautersii TaxID=1177982 RepID=A0ABU1IGJ9_9BURK|nr:hypothetical protein [Paracidovorax wautersii]